MDLILSSGANEFQIGILHCTKYEFIVHPCFIRTLDFVVEVTKDHSYKDLVVLSKKKLLS